MKLELASEAVGRGCPATRAFQLVKYIFKRTRLYDEKHFKEDLKNIDWDKIRSSSDVNEMAAKLEEVEKHGSQSMSEVAHKFMNLQSIT